MLFFRFNYIVIDSLNNYFAIGRNDFGQLCLDESAEQFSLYQQRANVSSPLLVNVKNILNVYISSSQMVVQNDSAQPQLLYCGRDLSAQTRTFSTPTLLETPQPVVNFTLTAQGLVILTKNGLYSMGTSVNGSLGCYNQT